jgi:hypothetical protein
MLFIARVAGLWLLNCKNYADFNFLHVTQNSVLVTQRQKIRVNYLKAFPAHFVDLFVFPETK